MIKKLKEAKAKIILGGAVLILFALAIWLIILTVNAKMYGTEIGKNTAHMVGNVIGAASAVANADEIFEQGAAEAVLAKDTKISEIKQALRVTGKLRVLEANTSLDSSHKIGEEYQAVYYMEGKVNFSVDLSKVDLKLEEADKALVVTIPEPVADLNIDSSTVKKLAESKKFSFIDDAEKGSEGYINSINKIKSNVKDSLENYDSLFSVAKDSAILQVKDLIGSLSFAKDVVVQFAGGEQ